MTTVTINNKKYNIPELGFKHMKAMEKVTGESIVSIFQKEQVFLLAEGFVGAVVECDAEWADYLLEQHIMGGGKIADIYDAFVDAAMESGFFKKVLGIEEEKPKKATQKKSSEQTAE